MSEQDYAEASEATFDAGDTSSPPPPLPPLWKRLIDTFVSPGQLMEALAATPKAWGALFVGAALVALSSFLIPADLYEEFIRATALERGNPVPEDLGAIGNVSRFSGLIGGPIFWTLWSLFVAGVATTIFVFLMGGEGKFKQYFAATTHSLLIPALGALLVLPLRIANEDPREVISVGTFLGGFMPEGYLLNVLNSMDVFAIAGFAVLAVGVSKIDTRRSFGSAFLSLLVFSVLIAMVFAIFA